MKKKFMVFLLILSVNFLKAQRMPEAFLGMLPEPPGNVCSEGDDSGRSAFVKRIGEVDEKLQDEISRRREEIEAKMDANEDKMGQNALARTGVSPELAQKMMALQQKRKGASDEQQKEIDRQMKAMTDQMMQESMNISMGEVENLKSMGKEGKQAWAEAYATEKKAEVMADPQAYQQKAATGMRDYQLVAKRKLLADSIGAQNMKYIKQFQELDNDKGAQALVAQIDQLQAKLKEQYELANRPNDNEIKRLTNSIRDAQISYCNMQSPKYISILSRYKTFLQTSLTPYYRLEKLTNQVTAMQTGVEIDMEPGLMGLEQIKAYLGKLSDVYRYNHISPAYGYIGAE